MKPEHKRLPIALPALLLIGLGLGNAQAAIMNWGAAQNITGDLDVSTVGMFLEAYNLGGATTTINGVQFLGVTFSPGTTIAVGPNDTLTDSFNISEANLSSSAAPFSNLSSSYQTLLGTVAGPGVDSPMTLTLSGLTVGVTYQFETWINVSNLQFSGSTNITSGGNTVGLNQDTSGVVGGLGQFVIGEFTADSNSQAIGFGGDSFADNGYELSIAAPEPSFLPMLAVFAAALVWVRRRPAA
jgi:hypothetical protein